MNVGILGHIGNENLGDEAIFTSVIANIRARAPQARIYGFTIRPQDTEARHGIPSFPIRRLKPSAKPRWGTAPGLRRPLSPAPAPPRAWRGFVLSFAP